MENEVNIKKRKYRQSNANAVRNESKQNRKVCAIEDGKRLAYTVNVQRNTMKTKSCTEKETRSGEMETQSCTLIRGLGRISFRSTIGMEMIIYLFG